MPRVYERSDSGAWQSPYTLERRVHQGGKYARAGAFKLIRLSSPLAVVPISGTDGLHWITFFFYELDEFQSLTLLQLFCHRIERI